MTWIPERIALSIALIGPLVLFFAFGDIAIAAKAAALLAGITWVVMRALALIWS